MTPTPLPEPEVMHALGMELFELSLQGDGSHACHRASHILRRLAALSREGRIVIKEKPE